MGEEIEGIPRAGDQWEKEREREAAQHSMQLRQQIPLPPPPPPIFLFIICPANPHPPPPRYYIICSLNYFIWWRHYKERKTERFAYTAVRFKFCHRFVFLLAQISWLRIKWSVVWRDFYGSYHVSICITCNSKCIKFYRTCHCLSYVIWDRKQ